MGILLFLGYYTLSIVINFNKVSMYIQVLSICFPFLIGIVTSMVVGNEERAGNFQTILTVPTQKYKAYFSQIFMLIFFGFIASILALVGFGMGFDYEVLNTGFYVRVATLLSISVLPLYMLQYIICLLCGKGFGLVFGAVGSLLSALLLTGLGDGIWTFLPWGIPARFSHIFLISTAMNTDFINSRGIIPSVLWLVIATCVLLAALVLLSIKWEGRTAQN